MRKHGGCLKAFAWEVIFFFIGLMIVLSTEPLLVPVLRKLREHWR